MDAGEDTVGVAAVRPPLPLEIQQLSEAETACTFCGVSYLMLARMERLQQEFTRLERELDARKAFAVEKPILLAENASLKGELVASSDRHAQLQTYCSSLSDERKEWELKNKIWDQKQETLQERLKECTARAARSADDWRKLKTTLRRYQVTLHHLRTDMEGVRLQLDRGASTWRTIAESICGNITQKCTQVVVKMRQQHFQRLRDLDISHKQEMTVQRQSIEAKLYTLQQELTVERQQKANERKNLTEQAQSEIHALHVRERELTNQVCHVKEESTRLKKTIETSQENHSILQEHLNKKRQEADILSEERVNLRAHVLRAESDAKGTIAMLQAEMDSLKQQLADSKRQMNLSANQIIAEKEIQLGQIRSSVSELNKTVRDLVVEKDATVIAHQNRIKQLQDSINERLAIVANEKSSELKATIQELTMQMTQQQERHDREKKNLEESNVKVKGKCVELERILATEAKNGPLIARLEHAITIANQTATTEASKSRVIELEKDNLQKQLSSLREELSRSHHHQRTDTDTQSQILRDKQQQIDALQTQTQKYANELISLKQTVKIECEERIKLLSDIDQLKRSTSKSESPASLIPIDSATSEGPSLGERSDSTASAFESALHKSTRKKERIKKKMTDPVYKR